MICQMSFRRASILLVMLLITIPLLGGSTVALSNQVERVRAYTRDIEFDYIGWILDALSIKLEQQALGVAHYLPEEARRQTALEYLKIVQQIQQSEAGLTDIYADPKITDPKSASAPLRQELDKLYARRAALAPLAESVLQEQLSDIVDEMDLSLAGQPVPPILYHSTPLPLALIVSPRDAIRQDQNISLLPDLTLEQEVALEDKVDDNLNVSSLVVGIGGIGVYPTMVMQTSDLNWLSEVIAHEWIHNYLSLRPLGVSYLNSPELRTMNETAASIAGKEIGRAVIERYYPELIPPPPQDRLRRSRRRAVMPREANFWPRTVLTPPHRSASSCRHRHLRGAAMKAETILETIGRTPHVRIRRLFVASDSVERSRKEVTVP